MFQAALQGKALLCLDLARLTTQVPPTFSQYSDKAR